MSTLTLWSPFAVPTATRPTAGFRPAADIVRDGDDAIVRLEVPGVDVEKDIAVEVEGDRLVVRGERRDETASEQGGRRVREIRYGSFRRSFALPSHVTADAVTATYDAGVLRVRVAGAWANTAAQRITIGGAAPAATETATQAADQEQPEAGQQAA